MWKTMDEATLKSKKVAELREIAKAFGLEGYDKMKKAELIEAMKNDGAEEMPAEETTAEEADVQPKRKGTRVGKGQQVPDEVVPDRDDRYEAEGILDMSEDGFGFLRFNNFLTSDKDIYVAPAQVRRFRLRTGDKVKGI